MTLAELQERITGLPTAHPVLNAITAEDLRHRKKVTDKELDELTGYYKKKLEDLEKAEQFESNGQTWFWAGREYLP